MSAYGCMGVCVCVYVYVECGDLWSLFDLHRYAVTKSRDLHLRGCTVCTVATYIDSCQRLRSADVICRATCTIK